MRVNASLSFLSFLYARVNWSTQVMTAHYNGEWAIALTSAGLVMSWGDCASGLGQGVAGGCVARQNCKAGSTSIKCQAEPQVIAFPPGADPVMVDIR